MELVIQFSIVECACGAQRQAEQQCDRCGCSPSETDLHLDRRRQIVNALESQPAHGESSEALTPETLWGEFQRWLDSFTSAYERTGEGSVSDAAARLYGAIRELDDLRERVDVAHRRRPHHAAWYAADQVLKLNARVVEQCVGALIAPTPNEAEHAAANLQSALDEAALVMDRLGRLLEGRSAMDEVELADEYGGFVVGTSAAFDLSGAENLVEFEARGVDLFEQITGSRDCPTGFGVRLQTLNLLVESSLDGGRFWEIARKTYETMIASARPFELLAQDEDWRRDYVDVAREAHDAGIEAAVISAGPINRRRDVRSGIRLGAVVAERLTPPLVATLLTVTRRSAYARERAKEIRTLLQEARSVGLGDLVEGVDLALRDADAHKEFAITDCGVDFTGTRREYDFLLDDDLVDRVLMGFESVGAMNIGIAAALPSIGVALEDLDRLLADPIDPNELLRIVVAMNGWTAVEVERESDTVRIRGTRTVESPCGIAASLVPALPADARYLILEGDGINGVRVASGPVAPYRRGRDEVSPIEKQMATIEALATWTIDGVPPIAPATLRKVVAGGTLAALVPAEPQRDALETLRAYAGLMSRLAMHGLLTDPLDQQLRASVKASLALREQMARGNLGRKRLEHVVGVLSGFAAQEVPALRTTW